MLGKLPVPGRPTILITVGQGSAALAVGAGGGCLDIFTLIYPFTSLSPSLWETARYRLKHCLKGPLNPKQPTNQPGAISRPSGDFLHHNQTSLATLLRRLYAIEIVSQPYAEKELTYWSFACLVLLYVQSILFFFPVWCFMHDMNRVCPFLFFAFSSTLLK